MRLSKAAAAAIAVLVIVIAPPVLLVMFIGNPYPAEGVDLASALTDDAILGLLAVVVWIAWAQFTLSLVVEAYAAVADSSVQVRLPVFGIQQDLARALIGAVISTSVVAPLILGLDSAYAQTPTSSNQSQSRSPSMVSAASTTSTPGATSTAGTTGTVVGTGTGAGEGRTATSEGRSVPATSARATSGAPEARTGQPQERQVQVQVSVRRGDSLWSLAERYLGDGDRWSEIAAANSGRTMSDGTLFSSADQIRPGWVLTVPVAAPVGPTEGDGYLVEAGDTLWDIAEDQLGDATRYPEIFTASRDTPQPGGEQLEDPDVIDVGWTLMVPSASTVNPQPATPSPVQSYRSAPQPGDSGEPSSTVGRGAGLQPTPDVGARGAEAPTLEASPKTAAKGSEGASAPTEPAEQGLPAGGPPAFESSGSGVAAGPGQGAAGGDPAADAEPDERPWMLTALTGAGMVLAGGLLLTLRSRRRSQARDRLPGTTIARRSPDLAATEKSIIVSDGAAASVQAVDTMLRALAAWSATQHSPMPALAAVELTAAASAATAGRVVLHLTDRADLPAPWHDHGNGLQWSARADRPEQVDQGSPARPWNDDRAAGGQWIEVGGFEVDIETVEAPYPLLATVGSSADGGVWLLNHEELGAVRVTGDPEAGDDFVRHLVAELATSAWSQEVRVDCIGAAAEVVAMDPARIAFHDPHDLGAVQACLDDVSLHASHAVARSRSLDITAATGRTGQVDSDTWPARLMVLGQPPTARERPDPNSDAHQTPMSYTVRDESKRHEAAWTAAAGDLVDIVRSEPNRAATAVVFLDPNDTNTDPVQPSHPSDLSDRASLTADAAQIRAAAPVTIDIDARGCLRVPSVRLALQAVGLPASEAEGCAALLAHADLPGDVAAADAPAPVPLDDECDADDDGEVARGWVVYADRSGALRTEHVVDRAAPGPTKGPSDDPAPGPAPDRGEDPAESVLPAPDVEYLDAAATTRGDLNKLAPQVRLSTRREVEDADPRLDDDLRDWADPDCRRPRLQLLGPVTARAYGRAPTKQRAYLTEVLAYIALRGEAGADRDELMTAFGMTPSKVRQHLSTLRAWLGMNPRTGRMYLPHADQAPTAQARGLPAYEIDRDLLLDADLFARLRLRGESRGPAGMEDLRAALRLVSGRPFTKLREGGWTWLVDEGADLFLGPAVADVAFMVVTDSLHRRLIPQARAAAEIALLAAPDEEATRLCVVRVCEAEGNPVEAERILRTEVCNRSDDGGPPRDLSERTEEILAHHQWLRSAATDARSGADPSRPVPRSRRGSVAG